MLSLERLAGEIEIRWRNHRKWRRYAAVYDRYRDFTMIPQPILCGNLFLCEAKSPSAGCLVECGVWRGGMSAAIADVLPGRAHYLLDSFEGLPPAREIDGPAAIDWQRDTASPHFHDNCRAEPSYADQAMRMSKCRSYELVKGWFETTLSNFLPGEPIAVLRLDCDWYDSTLKCLQHLYQHVAPDGLIIIDDYYTWDGCSRAVHDFLSRQQLPDRIRTGPAGVCYFLRSAQN